MGAIVLVLCIAAYFVGYGIGFGINKGVKKNVLNPTWLGIIGVILLTGFYTVVTLEAFEASSAQEARLPAEAVQRIRAEALTSVLLPGILVIVVAGGRALYKRSAK